VREIRELFSPETVAEDRKVRVAALSNQLEDLPEQHEVGTSHPGPQHPGRSRRLPTAVLNGAAAAVEPSPR
jgi:hypothetical protein